MALDNSWTQADTDAYLANASPITSCPPKGLMDSSYRTSPNALQESVSKRNAANKSHNDMVGGNGDVYLTTNPACKQGYAPQQFTVSPSAPKSVGDSTTDLNRSNNALGAFAKSQNASADPVTGGGYRMRKKRSLRRKRRKSHLRVSRKSRRKTSHRKRTRHHKNKSRRKKRSRKH